MDWYYILPIAALLLWLFRNSAGKPQVKTDRSLIPHEPIIGAARWLSEVQEGRISPTVYNYLKKNNWKEFDISVFGDMRMYMCSDESTVEHVLKSNWKNYQKNVDTTFGQKGVGSAFWELFGNGIFGQDGEKWRNHRKAASHMFSLNGLRQKMESVFVEHTQKLLKLLAEKDGQTVDLQLVFTNFTFDTMCEIAFGDHPDAVGLYMREGKKPQFLLDFDRMQYICMERFFNVPLVAKLKYHAGAGIEGQTRAIDQRMKKYVKDVIARRRKAGDLETRGDLLSCYLKYGKQKGKSEMLTDKYLIDVVLNFMVAGRDTTGCALTNVCKRVCSDSKVAAKFRKEATALVRQGTERGEFFNVLEASNAPYVNATFKETLRMTPPVGTDTRLCVKDDTLPNGNKVKAGTMVVVPPYAMSRNPNVWKDPLQFQPERWLSEDFQEPSDFKFPVFWAGPRICLGKRMAGFEGTLTSIFVLSQFDFEVLPHREEVFVSSPVLFYADGLPVKVKKLPSA